MSAARLNIIQTVLCVALAIWAVSTQIALHEVSRMVVMECKKVVVKP